MSKEEFLAVVAPNHYHSLTQRALKFGVIKKEPCVVCGRLDVHGHHEDYNRPLDIVWLCPYHHHLIHEGRGTWKP